MEKQIGMKIAEDEREEKSIITDLSVTKTERDDELILVHYST